MKKYFLRIENLLLLSFLFLQFYESVLIGNFALDISGHPYYNGLFKLSIAGSCISYLFHFALRKAELRKAAVCNLNITISIVLILLMVGSFFRYYYIHPELRQYAYERADGATSYFSKRFKDMKFVLTGLEQVFIVWQILFWIHCIYLFLNEKVKKTHKNKINAPS